MSDNAKLEEAAGLMKSGKKHGSKSITKWSADWDLAATDYERAARIFTHVRATDRARDAWAAAADAHSKAKNNYFAAKSVESLASMLKEDDAYLATEAGLAEVSGLYLKASNMYALDNKPERQSDSLLKAARITPPSQAKSAARIMHGALDALEDSEKYSYTPDIYRGLILVEVRGNLLVDAIATVKRQIKALERLETPAGAAKAGLEVVVLCLALGDFVLAEREYRGLQDSYGFAHSKDQDAAYGLLGAFDERDERLLADAVKHQALQFITPEIAKVAKRLKIGGVANVPVKTAGGANIVGGATAAAAADDDDDDLR